MKCKYCHSTAHQIDVCPTIMCKNCRGVGHPVWLCPSSASASIPTDSTSPESMPNESLPETSNKEQSNEQTNEKNHQHVNQSSYWKKKIDTNTMYMGETTYKFGSTNSLASPKNAVSPRIPSAASLSVESNSGGNGKRRDRGRDRDRNRERDQGRDHGRDHGKERNQGWVSSDISAPTVPPKSRNDDMMSSRGSTRYGDFGDFRNKNSQKESLPSAGPLRSIPDAPNNDSNHFMNQKVERRSNHHQQPSWEISDLQKVAGSRQPMQHRKEKQHVSERNESAEVSREQPAVIKAEEITVSYYQKMVGANWGDLVISAGFGSKSS
jgi:hypothetical protein